MHAHERLETRTTAKREWRGRSDGGQRNRIDGYQSFARRLADHPGRHGSVRRTPPIRCAAWSSSHREMSEVGALQLRRRAARDSDGRIGPQRARTVCDLRVLPDFARSATMANCANGQVALDQSHGASRRESGPCGGRPTRRFAALALWQCPPGGTLFRLSNRPDALGHRACPLGRISTSGGDDRRPGEGYPVKWCASSISVTSVTRG